jgi:hypothetical protein
MLGWLPSRARRFRAAALVLLGAAALVMIPSAAAASDVTAFTLDSLPGDLLAQGNTYWFAPPSETVFVHPYGDGVAVDVGASGAFEALITPPTGATALAVGTYDTTRSSTADTAGLDVFGNGVGCNNSTGSITVHQYQTDVAGNVTQFAATYQQLCDSSTEYAYGEIRFHSTLDYAAAVVDHPALVFPDTLATTTSAPMHVTVTNRGTVGLTLGSAVLSGQSPGDYAVTTDTCSGTTLAVGASCSASVTFTPGDMGPRLARLHFDDNTAAGGRTITLSGLGVKLAGSLTIAASKTTITYGGKTKITAHLGTQSTNTTVSIYRHPVGGSQALAASGAVDANGNFSVTLSPSKTTSYTAAWSGDATHRAAVTKPRLVSVRLVMHAAAKGAYATRSGYHLYHYTTLCYSAHRGCPRFLIYASPLHPTFAYTLHMQILTRSGWRSLFSAKGHLGPKGKTLVVLIYRGTAIRGHAYRIRFSVARHTDHLGDTSPWVKFKVI